MSTLIIENPCQLQGTVNISCAKNAILPVIAASLLTEDKCTLEEVAALEDVKVMVEVVNSLGAEVNLNKDNTLEIAASNIVNHDTAYELIRKMRASFLIMGPMLARVGKIRISLPGGCAIGSRPIDLHLKGFSAMGANITLGHG
ncbi:MAG: UDP-N-acetylglucosamine 1-carboxyvinyltransferase, partial [Clostridia bacterium]|nr:UDP-N-acetylglucosamine 1-carboxyvinyltransferase [Clostridia bacterium]